MENNDFKALLETFKEYRSLLLPIQDNLSSFVDTYETVKGDIEKLNTAFGADAKESLDKIYKNLSRQAESANELSSKIDVFSRLSNKYTQDMSRYISALGNIEQKLTAIDELEKRAEAQLSKLDTILEEKRKSYNVKDLQKTLEMYNTNVEKISEFINKDVSDVMRVNSEKLDEIKGGNEKISAMLSADNTTLAELLEVSKSSGEVIKNVVEKNDVNEAYIFDIIDKWAISRNVKKK